MERAAQAAFEADEAEYPHPELRLQWEPLEEWDKRNRCELMRAALEAVADDLLAALADETAARQAAEAETARLGRDWGHRTEKIIADRDAAVADADAQRAAADEWQARYEELLAEQGVER